ncbi:MAG TPA: ATP-binding cassette domain-containing protein [Chitinophagaceae bacterium]|nr:ATP-binding cassette domain-containing protein [Chitinophagaceae bacterium]
MSTLRADNISFNYVTDGKKTSWHNFHFSVTRGEAVSIIGSSGIGKTTLLRVLSGLHTYDSGGCVYIDDKKNIVRQPDTPIFIVFQEYNLTLLPWLTIEKNINLGLYKSESSGETKLSEALQLLFPKEKDHSGFLKKYPDQLSGGQKQRIQIARALVSNSEFIFFDEPDTGIDYKNKLSLRGILKNLVTVQNKGVILITHDLENAYELSNRFYIIHKNEETNTLDLVEFGKLEFCNLDDFRSRVKSYL